MADVSENSAATEEDGEPYQIPSTATDSSDPEALIGVPREREGPSGSSSENRRGRTATASEQLEGLIEGLDPATREDFEERAAILEFCGEMPQVEAEVQAYALVTGPKVSDSC